jgi:hypothetical protein
MVHRADRFVVTLSDKTLHVDCVAPHFAAIRAGHVNESPKIEHAESDALTPLTCAECGKPVPPDEEQFWGELCLHKEPCDRIWHERHGPEIEALAAKPGWRIAGDEDPF